MVNKLNNTFTSDKFLNLLILLLAFMPVSLILGNFFVNLNIVLIVLVLLFNLIKKQEFKIFIFKKFQLILLFFILILISDLIILDEFTYKSVGLFKFYFLFVAINYVLERNHPSLNFISVVLFVVLVVFSLDIIVQYFYGIDILGISSGSEYRFSGFMGDEWVAGSFISKLMLLSIISFIFIKKLKFFNIFLLALFFFTVLLTGERMALFNFLLIIFFSSIYLIYKNIFTFKDVALLTFSILFILVVFFSSLSNERKQLYTVDLLVKLKLADNYLDNFEVKSEDKEFIAEDINKKNTHLDLFITSYKLIKDNLVLGTGTNQFYAKCKDFKNELLHCENHSHNLYLNVFSEQGLIILIFFFHIIYKYVVINLPSIKKNKVQGLLSVTMLIILNPFSVSGDLFSTWTGTIFWYILGFYTFLSRNQKSIK
jgi:hypothetical protein